jgi:hypothetical protein
VTARALPVGDGDRRLEGVFRWGWIGGIAFEQDFAAKASNIGKDRRRRGTRAEDSYASRERRRRKAAGK